MTLKAVRTYGVATIAQKLASHVSTFKELAYFDGSTQFGQFCRTFTTILADVKQQLTVPLGIALPHFHPQSLGPESAPICGRLTP